MSHARTRREARERGGFPGPRGPAGSGTPYPTGHARVTPTGAAVAVGVALDGAVATVGDRWRPNVRCRGAACLARTGRGALDTGSAVRAVAGRTGHAGVTWTVQARLGSTVVVGAPVGGRRATVAE